MVRRLDKIPICRDEKFKISFHEHIYTLCSTRGKFLEPGPRDLGSLINKIAEKGLNAIAITDFGDEDFGNGANHEFWTNTSQLENLPDNWRYYQDNRVIVVVRDDGKPVYIFKSQEIPTSEGHCLVFGGRDNEKIKSNKSLDETLDEADKKGLLKLADHPYSAWYGVVSKGNLLKRLYNFVKGFFVKEDLPISSRFDAYEYNSNNRISNPRTLRVAKSYKIPVVANGDSHRGRDIGSSYNILNSEDLNYSSGDSLVNSISKNVRAGNFDIKKGKNSFGSMFHHIFMLGIYIALNKIGVRLDYNYSVRKRTK